jgi:choline-sulfatase
LLLSDEHNPHIAGFGGNEHCFTQNLDRLSSRGIRFDAAYCQSPLCVPSRLSMLQGKYVHHCSAWSNSAMLHSEETTLPRYLSKAGYTTACVGKMHISGPHWMAGFDHRPYGDLRVTRYCFHQPDPPETANGDWTTHTAGYLPYAGETRIPESLLADSVATREALGFLLELNDRDSRQPWFMCVGYSRPHHPLTTPGRYVRRALAGTPPIPDLPDGYPSALHPHDRFIVEDFNLTRFSREQQWKGLACYYACIDYLDDCR